MPHIIAIEYSDAQRRQLSEKLSQLAKSGWPLSARVEAGNFETWQKLFESVINPGLFAQREVIVVEEAEALGEFPEKLSEFLDDDKADCILILIYGTDTKNLKSITNLITLIKPEPQIPPWKRKNWLITFAKENKFTISGDAAQLLADSIEAQEELRTEIIKLGNYADGREITIEDVNALSFDEGGRAQMIFLDGLCNNKPRDVAHALKYLRTSPLLPVLTAITNRLRPALIISIFPGRYSDDALKAAGVDTTKKYNYALNHSRTALKYFGADKIKRFMLEAARLSFLEKTSRAEGWPGFELLIWELMT